MLATELLFGGFRMMKTYSKTAWVMIVPLVLVNILTQLFTQKSTVKNLVTAYTNPADYSPFASIGPMLLIMLIGIFMGTIVAVGWHRRTLLNERFCWSIPSIFRGPVYAYLIGIILFTLAIIGIYIAGLVVMWLLAALFGAATGGIGALIVVPVAIAFAIWLMAFINKISITLPARALERPISFREALEATQGQSWMLIRYSLMIIAIVTLVSLPVLFPMIQAQITLQEALLNGNTTNIHELITATQPSLLALFCISIFSGVMSLYQVSIMTILYSTFVRK